ncbi:Gst Glutathione S-transferase [Caulobacteraceae bacterium]
MPLVLHSFWRASAPYRVRIGLNLKGLTYDYASVDLATGAQAGESFGTVNAQRLVPALDVDGRILTQSVAILEWLEETYPEPALLPRDAFDRQTIRAMSLIVACDIHPLNNVRILKALARLEVDQADADAWVQRWISDGFAALEPMIARHGAGFAFGGAPTLADCMIVPQVYNARRFKVDLSPFPALVAAADAAALHPAIAAAHPNNQPDAKA